MNLDYDGIDWADVSEAASRMFDVWCGGGEILWVEECWNHFGKAGLTRNATPLEATESLLRLVSLARIYEEFCGLAWDENPETPISYLAEDLDIDPLALGILGGQSSADAFWDAESSHELQRAALTAATTAQRQEIYNCLVNAYGGVTELYSRMSATNQSSQEENDTDEFDVTGPNMDAFNFVSCHFQQG